MTDQPNDIDDVLNHRRDACQKPLDMSDAAQKAFADRQEKLIRSKRWPILNWYNDDDFCRAYNTAVALKAERDALAAELARLRTLEAALPKTADGVPVVPGSGSRLWYIHPDSHTIYERSYTADMRDARSHWIGDHQERHDVVWIGVEQCYSTREAAEAAREAEKARDA